MKKQLAIFVTGAAGFIGFHVSKKLLLEGYTVVGIDNMNPYYDIQLKSGRIKQLHESKKFIFYEGDVTDVKLVEKIIHEHKISKICHLAAQAGVRYSLMNPYIYEKTNIQGFITILESARKNGVQDIVYASSSSVYGNNLMPTNGFSEKDAVNQPISLYGMTKRSNELTAYTYHHLYDLHMTGLRFFTVYGPWGRPDMAYYKFTESIFHEKAIDVYNQGKMKRDFTYIDDIVSGVYSALQKGYPYEIFNLGNSHTVELMDFISVIEKELGKKAKINFLPQQPGDVRETYANISHAKKHLGFSPKISIEDGMAEFIQWYLRYKL